MIYYEIKKVFVKPGSKIAALLLVLLCGFIIYQSVSNVAYVNEKGETEYGISAIHKLRKEKKQWAGPLTTEKIREIIEKNAALSAANESIGTDPKGQDILYHQKQGYSSIRNLIIVSYCPFNVYEFDKLDTLSPEDAKYFYTNRTEKLREWLEGSDSFYLTAAEKAFLLAQFESLKTPFLYDWTEGWKQINNSFPALLMILSLILGFLTAGIFSGEFQTRADAVFFASFHGRKKAIHAKLTAGFLIVTVIYWTEVLLCSAGILAIFTADGANCPVQVDFGNWNCIYQMTYFQQYLMILTGGYIGCLFTQFLTIYTSARTRSTVLAAAVPFIIIFVPSLMDNFSSMLIHKLLGLMPVQMMMLPATTIKFDYLYQIGHAVTGAAPLLLVGYSLLTALLIPAIYLTYRKKQIL